MTFDRGRHEAWEELISASLTGDLTQDEATRLEAHLAGCDRCRATADAFGEGRRIMGGLRHVPPPRDLPARVRTGIERGLHRDVPWWRRPPAIVAGVGGGLAAVTGALLAIVLLQGPDGPPVGVGSPTQSALVSVAPSATVQPTLPPLASPSEASEPTALATATIEPEPTATPVPPSPDPDVYLAYTGPFDNLLLTVRDGQTTDLVAEVGPVGDEVPSGPPVAAELSPDGQFLAFITLTGQAGEHDVWVTRVAEAQPGDAAEPSPVESDLAIGETLLLGRSVSGSPFLEQLSWSSPRPQYLAFTVVDPEEGPDVWLWEPSARGARRLTDTGTAYAGSWVPGSGDTSLLWISLAGETPTSHLVAFHDEAGPIDDEPIDPATDGMADAQNVFLPLISPNGALAVYWSGTMTRSGSEWLFAEGGAPYLANNRPDGATGYRFTESRQLFTDLVLGREAFASAAIGWGLDSDAIAVWAVSWTGTPQGPGEDLYPDEGRVYFGRASDPRHITRTHAIDAADIPAGARAVDVKLPATGRHLLITVSYPVGGVQDVPRADLIRVTRNTGAVPDEVLYLSPPETAWYGPAALDADLDRTSDR